MKNPFNVEENTELMSLEKPSIEDYNKAKHDYNLYCSWAQMARNRKNELIDALTIERENELTYTKLAAEQRDIIRRYEIYAEIERKEKSNASN